MNKPTPEEKCSHEFYEVPKRMDIPVKCAKCGVMIDDSPSPEALKLQDPLPHNITFHNKDGKVIGEFNFDKLPCTFKGDVDESAKVFVDVVSQLITQRLQPSPEARVDWEGQAREILEIVDNCKYTSLSDVGKHKVQIIANVLSAAFEKGREAR